MPAAIRGNEMIFKNPEIMYGNEVSFDQTITRGFLLIKIPLNLRNISIKKKPDNTKKTGFKIVSA